MTTYGFLGLGIMGGPMAANLVRAGFDVTVWNRNPAKCAPLVALGARQASSPAEVCAACDITIAMLADPAAAKEVCFGPNGVLEGIGGGRGYIDMSTVDDETSTAIGAAVTARGGRFLEAPVSGTKKPAEDGTLIILAAGDRSLFDEAGPAFAVLGKTCLHLARWAKGRG
ncbi:NAD(P)-dependent oxidoreductase [Geobacter anodireducens]